jgi:hypothetical protein
MVNSVSDVENTAIIKELCDLFNAKNLLKILEQYNLDIKKVHAVLLMREDKHAIFMAYGLDVELSLNPSSTEKARILAVASVEFNLHKKLDEFIYANASEITKKYNAYLA